MEEPIQIKTNTTAHFLLSGKVEGYSFLVLLFIAMPLKYIFLHPEYVRIAGSIHGILFITFVFYIFRMVMEKRLSLNKAAYALLFSLIPFGTFYLKRLL